MQRPVPLLQAARDERLLGRAHPLRGPQARLLELMGGGEMLVLIAAGRQSGKTAAACVSAIWNACCRPDLDDVLPPGDERYILVAAPALDQARQFIRRCNGMLEHSPLRGLKTVWISTPKGQQGLFFERYQQGEAGVLPSTVVFRAPTWEMRPDLPRSYFETRREQQGEDFYRQELGAEFVSSGGSFFDLRGLVFESGPAPPERGGRWVCGLDPAFHNDKFGACLVGESMDERGVLLVGQVAAIDPGARLFSLVRRRAQEDRALDAVWELIGPYSPRIVSDQH